VGQLKRDPWLVSRYDLLFALVFLLFFLSENTLGIAGADALSRILEQYKVKYMACFLACGYFLANTRDGRGWFRRESRIYMANLVILTLISAAACFGRGGWKNLAEEALYFLVPLLFSYSLIQVKDGETESCMDWAFWITLLGFLIRYRNRFSLSAFLSVSFVRSYSPFEGEIAFLAMLFVIYYAWKGRTGKYVLSLILCLLSFKRLTIIAAAVFSLCMKRWKKRRAPSAGLKAALLVLFLAVPVIVQLLCSDAFAAFFQARTGLDLNGFAKGRLFFLDVAADHYPAGGGLGSLRPFLSDFLRNYYHTGVKIYDLHCDLMRFYLECTAAGLFSLLYACIRSAETWISLMFIVYILLESCVNHMFGPGRTMYWILAYLMLFAFNRAGKKGGEGSGEDTAVPAGAG
jgi:hypothetical protein